MSSVTQHLKRGLARVWLRWSLFSARRAFSLVEMLAVMAIIGIGVTLAAPSIGGALQSMRLAHSGDLIAGQLRSARQRAITRNQTSEVRLIRPGENTAKGRYTGLQLFDILETGSAVPVGRFQRLPESVFIDSGATLSSLIGNAQRSTGAAPKLSAGQDLGVKVPGTDFHYETVSFRFRPDGSTDLDRKSNWFITLHKLTDSDGMSTPPSDYITLRIDSFNGHVTTFRP